VGTKYRLIDADTGEDISVYDPRIIFLARGDPLLCRLLHEAENRLQAAFRPFNEVAARMQLTPKQLRTYLRKHPEIQTHKPWVRRLLIHVGDFIACYRPPAKAPFLSNSDVLDSYISETKERYEQEHRRKADG
jgi:hypothetical protein